MNVEKAKARRKEITDAQTAIVEKAEADKRQLTDGEKEEFRSLQDEFVPLHEDIQRAETVARNAGTTNEPIKPDAGDVNAPEPRERRSLGEQFVTSPGYEGLKMRGFRGAYSTGTVELRTLLDSGAASGGDAILPDYQAGIRPLRLRRLTVADLVLSGTTDSNTVSYVEEASYTNNAASVAEAAAKPESALTLNIVSEAVRKIAHWLPVTDEMLEDVSQIRSFIDNRLTIGLQLEEEDQILNGDGTAPNISGILDRVGLQTTVTVGAANAADSVFGMVTSIREDFYEPNGMVINPTDWGSVNFRLAKDANDQYYAGGPFTGQYGNGGIQGDTFWGLNVVVTPAIAAGTVLVGDFTQAQMFRKSGITVEASNSHASYFIENKTAIRAEERFALAVYAPLAFGVVDTIP